jgi:8-amino-7-oxononanoate synthase
MSIAFSCAILRTSGEDRRRIRSSNDSTWPPSSAAGAGGGSGARTGSGGGGGAAGAGAGGLTSAFGAGAGSGSFGAAGGAVLGSPLLRDHLVNTARTFLFDTGLAPAPAAAAAAACRIVAAEPHRVAALGRVGDRIAAGCGIPRAAGAVQSLPIGPAEAALEAAHRLEADGVLVGCFRPPSVPDGVSRLRLTARADLSPDVVDSATDQVVATIAALGCRA